MSENLERVTTEEYLQMFCEDTGYTPLTDTWELFSQAELCSLELDPTLQAIRAVFNQLHDKYCHNYKEYTELVIFLNWKIWAWHDQLKLYNKQAEEFIALYNELWAFADNYACDNFVGEELSYFLHTTD